MIVAFISSTEDEASSADAACSVVPWDICSAPAESCWLPDATLSDAPFTSATTALSFSTMFFMEVSSCPVSSADLTSILTIRLPSASRFEACTASSSGLVMLRVMNRVMPMLSTIATRVRISMIGIGAAFEVQGDAFLGIHVLIGTLGRLLRNCFHLVGLILDVRRSRRWLPRSS